jgi:hypothetical protein
MVRSNGFQAPYNFRISCYYIKNTERSSRPERSHTGLRARLGALESQIDSQSALRENRKHLRQYHTHGAGLARTRPFARPICYLRFAIGASLSEQAPGARLTGANRSRRAPFMQGTQLLRRRSNDPDTEKFSSSGGYSIYSLRSFWRNRGEFVHH